MATLRCERGDLERRRANLGYWLSDACADFPDRTALIDLSRTEPRTVTYAELDEGMNRVANLLVGAGVGVGDRIALGIGNRFEFVEIMFGAMRCGAVPVPLNIKLAAESLTHVLSDADCQAAFVDSAVARRASAAVENHGIERTWELGDAAADTDDRPIAAPSSHPKRPNYAEALAQCDPTCDPPVLPPNHPAFQPYTSGSTGKPKGVVLDHEGQLWWLRCLRKYWPSRPADRALAAVPLYHKNAMAGAVKPLLQAGGSVVILPGFEPRAFLRALIRHRCTQVGAVPAVFTILLRHMDLIRALDFSALKKITLGSAPVQPELIDAVERAFGVAVGESYGLTEGGPVMLGPPPDGRPVPRGSCGAPWPEGEVRLVPVGASFSPIHAEEPPIQAEKPPARPQGPPAHPEGPSDGELWVRNPGVTTGYHNLPEVNAARLQGGWLATGDLFHRDSGGFYHFRGRTDDMFNSGGENIYPKEVEDLLLAHPDVLDAAVVPLPHAVKGHVPAAMVTLAPGAQTDADELKAFTLKMGPAYAHPRVVAVVDEMPLNGVGKVDRAGVERTLRGLRADAKVGAGRGTNMGTASAGRGGAGQP